MIITPEQWKPQKTRGFVVLDGVNGAGKSTLAKKLEQELTNTKTPYRFTREPGGTPLGVEIRKLLLEHSAQKPSELAELFLFAADRAHHIDSVIEPSLSRKELVLCDRYYYSTTAFQGFGRGLPMETIATVNNLAVRHCKPDLVLLLDIDPKVGLLRTKGRASNDKDAFENEELAFHERLRKGFLEQAKTLAEPFAILDGTKTPEELLQVSFNLIQLVLNARA